MSGYRKILVAVDLTDESPVVIDKALALAKQSSAELHLVHVMQPIVIGYAVEVMSIDLGTLNAQAAEQARLSLLSMGGTLEIPARRLHSKVGNPSREIRELAKELAADLVVMGGHGKHGLDLLLGSTSSGVTHGISCDLLIVRLPEAG